MKGKKSTIKISIALIFVLIIIIGIVFSLDSRKNDFIINSAMDNEGNLYTLSYDENDVYVKKINEDKKIVWIDSFPIKEKNFINTRESFVVTPEGKVILYVYQYDLNTYKKR